MNRALTILAGVATTLTLSCWGPAANAAFFGLPRALKFQVERITTESPTLAPMAHTRFCVQYPQDCRVHGIAFRRPHPVALTDERMQDLVAVNRDVNRSIIPQASEGGVLAERWRVSPKFGECHDYAVTKRHELLDRHWPSRSLLLAEVVTSWGPHHLILVVRTLQGDLVLDNLNANIKPWSRTPYQWVRIQSPDNPILWSKVARSAA